MKIAEMDTFGHLFYILKPSPAIRLAVIPIGRASLVTRTSAPEAIGEEHRGQTNRTGPYRLGALVCPSRSWMSR